VDGEDDPDALAERLLERTAELTAALHPAIDDLRGPGAVMLEGAPVAAVFDQQPGGRPRHRSGRPSEAVVRLAAEAARRVRARVGYAAGEDNPALPALALAAFYTAEARRADAFGLARQAHATPRATALDEDDARRDPVLPAGVAAIRVWTRLAGRPPACVELRFDGVP
jgi:hypothetical protein